MQIGGRAQASEELQRSRIQLARHRRPGPRCADASDLWLPHLGAVRPRADDRILGHRRRRRRRARLFRRLDRSSVPALHRNMDLGAGALSAAYHFVGAGTRLLRAARNSSAVLLGAAGRPGARRIPARAKFRIHPGGAGARRIQRGHHVPPPAAERDGGDADLSAVHYVGIRNDAHRARLPRLRPAARLAFARRTPLAGQGERAGAVARAGGLLHRRHHAVAADLHRRSRARRIRSAKDVT